MSDSEFDPTPYLHAPILDAASALALSQALHSSQMKGAPPEVKRAADKMMKAREALQTAWSAYSASSTVDKRPADTRLDNAWSALHRRIEAYSWLPEEDHPDAKTAAVLIAKLFASGLSFLTLAYPSEWAESERRLALIDSEKLEKKITAIAGAEFLVELRAAHAAYGEILGITKAKKSAALPNISDPLAALRRAIGRYTLKVAAVADDDESVAQVRASLAPIDAQREAFARRSAGDGPTPTNPDASKPPTDTGGAKPGG